MAKVLTKIKWKDIRVGDEFPEDHAVVTNIWEQQLRKMYVVTAEGHDPLVMSDSHLISVDTDEPFDQYELTRASKEQSHKEAVNWIAAEDAYNHFPKNESGFAETVGADGVRMTIGLYKNGEPQACRCITTNKGSFKVNGILTAQSSRGDHDMMEMKDIVADLSRSGMSDQWIATNLFLDKESITRFKQLSGMRSAFNTEEGLSEAWDPVADGNAERRKNIDLSQAARRYIRRYRELAERDNIPYDDTDTDIFTAAEAIGWDRTNANEIPKSLDESGRVFETENPSEEVETN